MGMRNDIHRIAVATEGMETALKAIAAIMAKGDGQPPEKPPEPVPGVPVKGRFGFQFGLFSISGENMDATVPAGTKGYVAVDWVDAFGNPGKVDGPTVWQSSDDSIVKATIAPDDATSQTAQLESLGPIGTVSIQATCDADLGAGTKNVTALASVTVIAGEVVGGTIRPVGTQPPTKAKK